VFIDAIGVKIRDGQVANQPVYAAIRTLWTNAWSEFVPFLDRSPDIRRVLYSTNASR